MYGMRWLLGAAAVLLLGCGGGFETGGDVSPVSDAGADGDAGDTVPALLSPDCQPGGGAPCNGTGFVYACTKPINQMPVPTQWSDSMSVDAGPIGPQTCAWTTDATTKQQYICCDRPACVFSSSHDVNCVLSDAGPGLTHAIACPEGVFPEFGTMPATRCPKIDVDGGLDAYGDAIYCCP